MSETAVPCSGHNELRTTLLQALQNVRTMRQELRALMQARQQRGLSPEQTPQAESHAQDDCKLTPSLPNENVSTDVEGGDDQHVNVFSNFLFSQFEDAQDTSGSAESISDTRDQVHRTDNRTGCIPPSTTDNVKMAAISPSKLGNIAKFNTQLHGGADRGSDQQQVAHPPAAQPSWDGSMPAQVTHNDHHNLMDMSIGETTDNMASVASLRHLFGTSCVTQQHSNALFEMDDECDTDHQQENHDGMVTFDSTAADSRRSLPV